VFFKLRADGSTEIGFSKLALLMNSDR